MLRAPACFAALTLLLGLGAARVGAAEPARRGAVVVAVGPRADAAAHALARAVYREPSLRPDVDEATARVLTGAAAPSDASAKLTELAALRASLPSAGSDMVQRRLLASIGADLHAVLVIPVEVDDAAAPRAKILRVEGASFVGTELVATRSVPSVGQDVIEWPGAPAVLRALLPSSPPPQPLAPRAPPTKTTAPPANPKDTPATSRTSWSSPWLWGGLGVLAAAGVTVFVLSRVEADADPAQVRVQGRVAP
jgi:hypothetical protein